ncbi:MAG: SpoIIE family protein phosphatase [Thermoanaerobaculaceae bacterium]|nr:SpoIIE family protein phosphatase [Thermoanaerobaculaceae bacterium]
MSGTPGALLVVDDNPENRDMLARRLRRRGYDVAEAEDGAQALELAAGREFDLVLLDVMMPVMDGLETLRRLRRTRSVAELPVIMTTAKGESEDVVQALTLGANDYVTKPINLPVALARIETQLSLRRAVQEIRRLEADLAARNRDLETANGRLSASNARMKRDLEAAARIQQTFLPAAAPSAGGARFAWRYRPCDELAGDTLNVVPLDERHVGVFVVDVSGHGVPAALLSVTVSRLLSRTTDGCPLVRRGPNGSSALEIVPPAEVAAELTNRFPFDPETRQYFTCVYGVLDGRTGEFRFVCAGHPGPVHVAAGRSPVSLQHPGRPIGILPAPTAASGYADHAVTLAPGDRLYLFTDGITEAAGLSDEQFGFERLTEALCASRADPLQASVDALVGRVEAWCGESGVADDVSVLAIEF